MELSGIELRYLVNEIKPKVTSGYYVSNITAVTKDSFLFNLHHTTRPRHNNNDFRQRYLDYKTKIQTSGGEYSYQYNQRLRLERGKDRINGAVRWRAYYYDSNLGMLMVRYG